MAVLSGEQQGLHEKKETLQMFTKCSNTGSEAVVVLCFFAVTSNPFAPILGDQKPSAVRLA